MNRLKIKTEPFVVLLIGPPLSGKTTSVNKLLEGYDYSIISRDNIVLDIHGSDNYNDAYKSVNQKEVTNTLTRKLIEAGKSDKNFVIDMTHMGSKRRMSNLFFFPNHYKIGVIFPILSDEEYDRRNKKREEEENKFIPKKVISDMISSYQPIHPKEGFNKVITL